MIDSNFEFIHAAKSYAEIKGISFDIVIAAMEKAIKVSESKKYNYDKIVVTIDCNNGKILSSRQLLVIKDSVDHSYNDSDVVFVEGYQCVFLSKALQDDADVKIGDIILESLPKPSHLRISTIMSRGVFFDTLNDAIYDKQYNEFTNYVGKILVGIVKRVNARGLIVDMHKAETTIPIQNLITKEIFRVGDRVKAYLSHVKRLQNGVKIALSRTHPQFVAELFRQEIPEIYDGVIEIKSISRAPGSRSKIAVVSKERDIDPVGSCIGIKGSRIQSIINELNGEKVDVVLYSEDPVTFVINAMVPAEILRVIVDERKRCIEVVVPENQLSIAIGNKGQNVGLASTLVGWKIDVLGEESEAKKRKEELTSNIGALVNALDVEEMIAQILIVEGFSSVRSVAEATEDKLLEINGFDKELASEIKQRAISYLQNNPGDETEKNNINVNNFGQNTNITLLDEINSDLLLKLLEVGINTVGVLAEYSNAELREIIGENNNIDDSSIDKAILDCRKKLNWFNC